VAEGPVDPIVAAGRATAVATIRALASDSEDDFDALSSLLDDTDPETLRAALEELGLLFVAVARPPAGFLERFGLQAALAATTGEATE
jgi:hypothetical protein